MTKEEDLILINQAKEGNKEAFEKLYKKYYLSVKAYIISRCFNRDKVDDYVQETWKNIFEYICEYDPEKASFYIWATRYWAENVMKKEWSKASKEIKYLLFYPPHDIEEEVLEKYNKLLEITCSEGGPPHQVIAFGFNKLISGWRPQSIVKELSSIPLRELCKKLIESYCEESRMPEYEIEEKFKLLCEKMDKKVKDVLEERTEINMYQKEFLEKEVGDTTLNDYYGKDPEHNISDWSNKVRKRVYRLIKDL